MLDLRIAAVRTRASIDRGVYASANEDHDRVLWTTMKDNEHPRAWICINGRCLAVSARTARTLSGVMDAMRSRRRVLSDRWIRYHLPLRDLPPRPDAVTLHPIDAAMMNRLRSHPERDEPQVRSALRFWISGVAQGYVWLDGDEPLCMQWLVNRLEAGHRYMLGPWAGMYPRLPERTCVMEGLHSFRRSMRVRHGVATPMAIALCHEARQQGFTRLLTQIHVDNLPAHRWAARVGWQPYGMVNRYGIDLPMLRGRHVYLHTLEPAPAMALSTSGPNS
jgi:hypothetical protein